ncbi:hypothetical protein CEXT_319451 [Caerostris extrusa]|uniref:Uncharacterized protein n=1 Tax=Caerostris extrusa TaxID=172846 RepID=A0AAV4UVT6_CAEEX|nr:hypothetical protein CEXT_319451 [Caerostris extrusa]
MPTHTSLTPRINIIQLLSTERGRNTGTAEVASEVQTAQSTAEGQREQVARAVLSCPVPMRLATALSEELSRSCPILRLRDRPTITLMPRNLQPDLIFIDHAESLAYRGVWSLGNMINIQHLDRQEKNFAIKYVGHF